MEIKQNNKHTDSSKTIRFGLVCCFGFFVVFGLFGIGFGIFKVLEMFGFFDCLDVFGIVSIFSANELFFETNCVRAVCNKHTDFLFRTTAFHINNDF